MNEMAVRELVREAVARHLAQPPRQPVQPHASHGLYLHLANPSDACLIEPAVPCNHCGYCQSHGH